MLRKFKAFTTVEILVAVGLIAILMVVAVPRLLGSREAVSDSSAQQQINAVKMAVDTWFAERDTYDGLDATTLGGLVPEVKLVAAGEGTGRIPDGRSLQVSVSYSDTEIVLAASNGELNCWGLKMNSTTGNTFYSKADTAAGSCSASTVVTGSESSQFEFPRIN